MRLFFDMTHEADDLTALSDADLRARIAALKADIADPSSVPRDREYRHPPFTDFPSLNDPDDVFEGDVREDELAALQAEHERRAAICPCCRNPRTAVAPGTICAACAAFPLD